MSNYNGTFDTFDFTFEVDSLPTACLYLQWNNLQPGVMLVKKDNRGLHVWLDWS